MGRESLGVYAAAQALRKLGWTVTRISPRQHALRHSRAHGRSLLMNSIELRAFAKSLQRESSSA